MMNNSKHLLLKLSFLLISVIFLIEFFYCLYLILFTGSAGPVLLIGMLIMVWPITLIIIAVNILCIFAFVIIKEKLSAYEDNKKTIRDLISLLLAVLTFFLLTHYLDSKKDVSPYSAEFKGFNTPSQP